MKNFSLIGNPLSHSISPLLHSSIFYQLGLDHSYELKELNKEDFEQEFSTRESQTWKPWAMIPIKISNTDPTSGLIVHSRAEIVRKDGSVTEFEAAETYFFDLDGKITGVNQFTRAVPQPQTEE